MNTAPSLSTLDIVTIDRGRGPLPLPRLWRAYLQETRVDIVSALRTPAFALPFIAVPVAIYVLFAVVINADAARHSPFGAGIADYLFCGFATMAAIMPGLFSGVLLAQEREAGLLRLRRALPQPPGATVVAKVLMAMSVAALALALVTVAALLAGRLTISPLQVAVIYASLVLGTVPFAAIGLWIGALSSASAAPAYANLLFLPMIWLSGLFIPLPASLQRWVVLWPAFHLDQFALGLAGVDQFTYVPPTLAAAVLLGVTLLFGGLAVRRLARVG
jgi:ABC-2 type transport system permease protein